VKEKLEEVVEEGLGDVEGLGGIVAGGDGVGVADDGLVALVDAEGEAADAAVVEGDEAGEDAGVEVLEKELGGALVVPAEALLPDAGFGFEERAQLERGEVTEVNNFEFSCYGHTLSYPREELG
jgi:hypothetical protein